MPALGRAIDYGSAHRGHALDAALPCRPRAAPAGVGCRPAPRPPCDRGGHQLQNPGHPSPPGAIALMLLPGEQMPGHAACKLDQWRRPWRRVPPMSPVCEIKFDLCGSTRRSASTFSLRHAAVTPCLQSMPRCPAQSMAWHGSAPSVQPSPAPSKPVGVGGGCHRGTPCSA